MTQMLASVMSLAEAEMVLDAGVDIIDLKDPNRGALGALSIDTVRDIVQFINGRALLSATIGDLPMQPTLITEKVIEMSATGVDIVKVGLFGHDNHQEVLASLQPCIESGIKIVFVLFADEQPDLNLTMLSSFNIYGLMLDTQNKSGKNLLNFMHYNDLQSFIHNACKMEVCIGLAGSLNIESLELLMQLQPDFLGFRGALCEQQQRTNRLNNEAIKSIKTLLHKSNRLARIA